MAATEQIDMLHDYKIPDDRIMELWDELDSKYMPERFSHVLVHFSESDNFSVAINEWRHYPGGGKDHQTFCICSKEISDCHYIENKHNGNVLRIGCDCAKKYMTKELAYDIDIAQKQLNYAKYGVGGKRMCVACLKHKIDNDEPSWKTKCKSCYREGRPEKKIVYQDGRQCVTCHRSNIPADAESWKMQCLSCYRNSK